MKRILFVIPYLTDGGAERVVSIWTSELVKHCKYVHLLLFYRVENEYIIDSRVKIHTISDTKEEYEHMNKLKKIMNIRKILKSIKPDVVIPFVTYVGIAVNMAVVGLSIKVIETIRIDPRVSPQTKFGRFIRNLSVCLSKGCIVQTKTQLQYFPKWLHKRMIVLSNPILPYLVNYKKEFNDNDIKKIITVGRLEKQKNFSMLIKAFWKISRDYKDLYLDIYGDGSLKNEIIELIHSLELDECVKLCGRTNNIEQVLYGADLFILPSNSEGMPNSLMEAMAVGLPCISTDCPTGPGDLIESGMNGYLIPVGDTEELIKAMKYMLDNRDAAISMGIEARQTILHNYSASESTKKLLDYINRL